MTVTTAASRGFSQACGPAPEASKVLRAKSSNPLSAGYKVGSFGEQRRGPQGAELRPFESQSYGKVFGVSAQNKLVGHRPLRDCSLRQGARCALNSCILRMHRIMPSSILKLTGEHPDVNDPKAYVSMLRICTLTLTSPELLCHGWQAQGDTPVLGSGRKDSQPPPTLTGTSIYLDPTLTS